MISIILPISSFDNVSHDDKSSRISHNSIILWQDLEIALFLEKHLD